MDKPLDLLGREIKVGDTVVYGVYTRNGGLQVAKVLKITPFTPQYGRKSPNHDFKVQIKTPAVEKNDWRNDAMYLDPGRKQTLEGTRRFAIVEPDPDLLFVD